jgi:ribosome biogenesis GTPase
MRALRLTDVAGGIEEVFKDLAALAEQCKFRDCSHVEEPGCAIQAEIAAGNIDANRLRRWQKLLHEDVRNSETLSQSRSRSKATVKYHKRMQGEARTRKSD